MTGQMVVMCDFVVTHGKRFRTQIARGFDSVSARIFNAHRHRYVGRLEQFTYSIGHIGDGQDKSFGHVVGGLGAAKNGQSPRDTKLLEQLRRYTVRSYHQKSVTHRVMGVQRGGIHPVVLRRFRQEGLDSAYKTNGRRCVLRSASNSSVVPSGGITGKIGLCVPHTRRCRASASSPCNLYFKGWSSKLVKHFLQKNKRCS